jgi:hypothetical protein
VSSYRFALLLRIFLARSSASFSSLLQTTQGF